MKLKYQLLGLTLFLIGTSSCDSLLDIDPPSDSITDVQTYSTAESIETAAVGLYTNNFLNNAIYYQLVELYLGLTSDEVKYAGAGTLAEYYQNTYSSTSSYFTNLWTYPYKTIYQCNDFILHVEGSSLIDERKKQVYLGEAYFFRAYSYFLLVNMFGDVPLVLTNKFSEARTLPREDKAKVYDQIIDDLKQAEEKLTDSGNAKTRITSEAAKALLARVYLYTGQWSAAIEKADELIPATDGGKGAGLQLTEVDEVFRASSAEAILQIDMAGYAGAGTYSGYTRLGVLFVPSSNRTSYILSDELVEAVQADEKDLRNRWIGHVESGSKVYYFPYKYKYYKTPEAADEYEYFVLLRLAEQYLIRAEAKAQAGDVQGALQDINRIRNRAGVEPIDAASKEVLLSAIEDERRKEFFVEGGHRWFDLNRTGRADAVYSEVSYKAKTWKPSKALYPIPETELGRNRNLTQNPDY